jgi:hypothetical protein
MTYPDSCFVGAYWGPRKESPDACASRAADFLSQLAGCDPLFAQWYKSARSRKGAHKQLLMPPDVSVLTDFFRRGANREVGGPAFEDLGYQLWIGNEGAEADSASLRMRCGDFDGTTPNSCYLTLPAQGPCAERVWTPEVLSAVVRSMVSAWEPDWVAAMSRHHQELDDPQGNAAVWVGWVTYLSHQRGTVPPLPAPVLIEKVEDKGTLILLTPERFTVANAEHVALAKRVRELLSRAGLLSPPTR